MSSIRIIRPLLSGVLLVLFAAVGAASGATVTGIESFTNPAVWPNADNQDWSLGWEFSVTGSVTVYALGYNYFGAPLNSSHQVGIYDSSETLLGSATVTNASSLDNGYLYTSLASPLTLASGDYWIAGCIFRRSRSRFRADDDRHSGVMAITIGAKRRWLVS